MISHYPSTFAHPILPIMDHRTLPLNNEPLEEEDRFGFRAKVTVARQIREYALKNNRHLSEIFITGAQKVMEGVSPTATTGMDEIRLPLVAKVPCGPMSDAEADPKPFQITADVADFLDANPRVDQMFVANGESMEGAGIEDGAALLVRPYPHGTPRREDVALIQVFDDEGGCKSTVKRVSKWGQTPADVVLHDGNGQNFPLPENTTRVEVVGAVKGIISVYRN